MLSQFLEQFSQLFEETGNLEKCNLSNAKPLFLSIQRQGVSLFFHQFFKTSSRASMLSMFYRFLAIWGLHLETFGSTFGGHFFRSQKSEKIFLGCAPGLRLSWTPPGEGGNWGTFGRHLGGIWAKGGPEEDLKEIVPKHMCFSVESGASDRFACTRAT